ncbi:uncharacterized protein MYCFIDRAFT_145894, partial [Pseudocercospora fijiensis CIRAD86]
PLPTPTPRSKPMLLLCLGLSRSGTDSLRNALILLGYAPVYHGFEVPTSENPAISRAWTELGRKKFSRKKEEEISKEEFEGLLGGYVAVTDLPCGCFGEELLTAYPDAKVILNYRDVEGWYESIGNTFGKYMNTWEFQYLSYFDGSLYWLQQVFVMYERGFFRGSILGNGKRVHAEHYARLREVLKREDRGFLEWRVRDGWVPLCGFLGKDVPDVEFPSGNTPAQSAERGARVRKRATERAYRNLAVISGGVVTCVAVLIALLCLPTS